MIEFQNRLFEHSGKPKFEMTADDIKNYYTAGNDFSYNGETGVVTPAGLEFDKGVGFYKNANTNRESNATNTMWTRNNKYVYGNKIYYRGAVGGGGDARGMTRSGIDFVPMVFDWEEYKERQSDEMNELREYVGDGCVYDMQGRRVATEQQVLDGTWKQRVSPGIYIINGKKISVN